MNVQSVFRQYLLLGASSVSLLALPLPARAQAQAVDGSKTFHIAQQSATEALIAFSQASEIQVISAGKGLDTTQVHAVDGTMPPAKALDAMLAGTGLRWHEVGGGTFVVEKQASVEGRPASFVTDTTSPRAIRVAAADESAAGSALESQPNVIPEIIVTAQKRRQASTDVGLTLISATSQQLKNMGITDVASLDKITPGLAVSRSNNNYLIFSIRGVSFNGDLLSAQPAVSVYLDEAPLAYPAMVAGGMFDLERVEVLKGPQGTLFGQNATGGSINLIAAKPTDTFKGGADLTVNNYGGISAQGFVSGPLSDKLLARVSATTDQGGAWQKSYVGVSQKIGSADRAAGRLLLDWRPSDSLKVELNLNGSFDHGEPQTPQFSFYNPSKPALADPALSTFPAPPRDNAATNVAPGFRPSSHDDMYQGILRADYEVNDNLTATSLTNFVGLNERDLREADGTNLNLLDYGPNGHIGSFSQELRLTGQAPAQNLHYTFGANYQRDSIRDGVSLISNWFSGLPRNTVLYTQYKMRYGTAGVYGDADWEFMPRLTLTTGVRYSSSQEGFRGCYADGGNGNGAAFFNATSNVLRGREGLPPTTGLFLPGGCLDLDDRPTLPGGLASYLPGLLDLHQTEHNVSWRGGLNFKPTKDSLVYGLVSRGFKIGGYPIGNDTSASQFQAVKQEQVTAYELGIKESLWDGTFRPNLSVFYYDYLNKQVKLYYKSLLGFLSTYQNIPTATIKGIDFDAAIVLGQLTLRPGITYVHSAAGNDVTITGTGVPTNINGNSLNYSPDLSMNMDAEYDFDISSYEAFVGGHMQYESKTYADLAHTPTLKIPAYAVFDARIGIRAPQGWHASFWVHNLANRFYYTNVFSAGDNDSQSTGLPRTFGLTAGTTF